MFKESDKTKMTEATFNAPNLDTRPILGRLMSGEEVVDRFDSHSHTDPGILERALSMIDSRGERFIKREVFMGEPTGYSECVETADGDEIVYAYRAGRYGPTRFVKNRQPEPTETVSVILLRDDNDDKKMVLITSWAGEMAEPEPWDRNATPESTNFWSNHALVWGSQEIDGNKPIIRG